MRRKESVQLVQTTVRAEDRAILENVIALMAIRDPIVQLVFVLCYVLHMDIMVVVYVIVKMAGKAPSVISR